MEKFSRRDFGTFFAVAAVGRALPSIAPPAAADEWAAVRSAFILDPKFIVMNAANFCPATRNVSEIVFKYTRDMDSNPSQQSRAKFSEGREQTRRKIAAFLNATPEEVVITRNTSEGNNLVSSGIELKAGDEVVVHDENHPTNLASWQNKARRYGFTVKTVNIPTPPPSAEALIKPFVDALTANTKVLAFTHVTSSFGSQFPAKELCRIARERGILTLIDGAQSFGVLDLDLKDIGCDFFTGSSHKWLMGPKEAGILYIRSDAQSRLWSSNYGVYGGTVGASRTFEQLGQRDDPTFMAMGTAVDFHMRIGKKKIEAQAKALAAAVKNELRKIPGVHMYSPAVPEISGPVVTFRPGGADTSKMAAFLYEKIGFAGATRGGDTPGIRISPHVYNSFAQVEKVVAAISDYMKKA
jgi:selenocysteine lyase/cysteine desulfurase